MIARRTGLMGLLLAVIGLGSMHFWTSCQSHFDWRVAGADGAIPVVGNDAILGHPIELPNAVLLHGDIAVEDALSKRRSVRTYSDEPLALGDLAQLLWAAQGITDPRGYRTTPSAGALYPLEVYVVVGRVEDLPPGIYHYMPQNHELVLVESGDRRTALSQAALGQEPVRDAAAVLVIAGVYARTTAKYGDRGIRYVHMEVGTAAQNVYLQAAARGLGTVFIGAFDDEQMRQIVGMKPDEQPLSLMPVGLPKP